MYSNKLFLIAILLVFSTYVRPSLPQDTSKDEKQSVAAISSLWREPSDIGTLNLFYGPGGEAGQPKGPFRFIKEDKDGSNPKFVVEDSQGVQWKVKLGPETQPETAATRLLWAVGYFTDIDYYLPRLEVADLPKLSRGKQYIVAKGVVEAARMQRVDPNAKKVGTWSWFENPFRNTQEFNGLRVMMALVNNWDLKEENNAIYEVQGTERRYMVGDLGATFGKTGGNWTRSKGKVEDYVDSDFLEEMKPQSVDLQLKSRPPVLYTFAVPYYVKRTNMGKITEGIPREHAKWIGEKLAQLSDQQLTDAFRGAGFTQQEALLYALKVSARIRLLNNL